MENVGKRDGLEIFRIESKKLAKVSGKGEFYSGDSYLILKTLNNASKWNLHFWLGKESSVDEKGFAAYYTVQLDNDILKDNAVQYREVEGFESDLFLSYFEKIRYLPGGVESSFNHVEDDLENFEPRLLKVKGKHTVRVSSVKCKNTSLSSNDVFILDAGKVLYLYTGANANIREKAKGAEVLQGIKNNDRMGKASVVIMDDEPENEVFWNTLGGKMDVQEGTEDDVQLELVKTKVLKVSDASSEQVTCEDVTPQVLTREVLDEKDVFIVDSGKMVYVWIGKGASQEERKDGLTNATNYVRESSNHDVSKTQIVRVVQHAECSVFKALFREWEKPKTMVLGKDPVKKDDDEQEEQVDVSEMLQKSEQAEQLIETCGDTELTIWRIENMEKVLLDKELYGRFYAGDSYIVLYQYAKKDSPNKKEAIIYFWQGNNTSIDEKAVSAYLTVDMDNVELSGKAVQIRVVQGKEPMHFRSLFEGRMIICNGGVASGFNGSNEASNDSESIALYHVKGSSVSNTCACQVEASGKKLNSGDCFVLVTPNELYVWSGEHSSAAEQDVAQNVAALLATSDSVEVMNLSEGSETDEFWEALGGQETEYASETQGDALPQSPRLFECSNTTGKFKVDEIINFTQSDLCVGDIYLLDTYSSIYLWIGNDANQQEQDLSAQIAKSYLDSVNAERSNCPIVSVHQGNEPLMFTCNFLGWDDAFFESQLFVDPYALRLEELRKEKQAEKDAEDEKIAKQNKDRQEKLAEKDLPSKAALSPKAVPSPKSAQSPKSAKSPKAPSPKAASSPKVEATAKKMDVVSSTNTATKSENKSGLPKSPIASPRSKKSKTYTYESLQKGGENALSTDIDLTKKEVY